MAVAAFWFPLLSWQGTVFEATPQSFGFPDCQRPSDKAVFGGAAAQ
ncbi:MAG: hypothetical protein JWM59_2544 [Verrucomicrobiales bacterium]|nr:hypothetical protein [Verrucomicrobiales bacterium]